MMFFVLLNLVVNVYFILTRPEISVVGAKFVLPGFIPGLTVYWWLVAIATVLVVHEFSHGFLMRCQGVPAKSMGLLLFVAIPGAFVEPDEKKLNSSPISKRLRVFGAGPFANIVFGLACLFVLLSLVSPKPGVYVWGVKENGPCENLALGSRLLAIDNFPLESWRDYLDVVENLVPGETVTIDTDRGSLLVIVDNYGENENRGSLGIWPVSAVSRSQFINPLTGLGIMVCELVGSPVYYPYAIFHPYLYDSRLPWELLDMLKWMFVLNLGIGMFNLLPLLPLDGGYILRGVLETKASRRKARRISNYFSVFVFVLLLVNILPMFM